MNEDDLDVLDKEANHFASKVLAPDIVLLRVGWENPNIIHEECAMSIEASKYKANAVIKYGRTRNFFTNLEQKILHQFHSFIHQRNCAKCSHYFIIPSAKYCPVCGSNKIYWGREKNMVYDGFELDEDGKAKKCPRCENQEIDLGDYCKICGVFLKNICLGEYSENSYNGEPEFEINGCKKIVPGNARYCPYCGKRTTFFYYGLLKAWNHKEENTAILEDPEIPF